jgi:hypothetical protein
MKRIAQFVVKLILIAVVFTFAFQLLKPQPALLTINDRTSLVPPESVRFLADVTYTDKDGRRVIEQEIWDTIAAQIQVAERFVLADMFLFNDFQGSVPEHHRALSSEFANLLMERSRNRSTTAVALITDPINTVYGGQRSEIQDTLIAAGVLVVETNLRPLRDSNIIWSAAWRPIFQWFDNNPEGGWLPHPFDDDGGGVTFRSWAELLNFKANHRKLVISDVPSRQGSERKFATLVTSSNPHDASSAHGNVAIQVRDRVWRDVFDAEQAIADLSGHVLPTPPGDYVTDATGTLRVTPLRDARIRDRLLNLFALARAGDTIDIAMFYLSDRSIIDGLIAAAERGAQIRLILDPNKDAFGHTKNGIPNRPAAKELGRKSKGRIEIRWCDTHGEQCHEKLVTGKIGTNHYLLVGSANLTRRNIGDYNLELDMLVEGEVAYSAWSDAHRHFERRWGNEDGNHTVDFSVYGTASFIDTNLYRFGERTGLSTY